MFKDIYGGKWFWVCWLYAVLFVFCVIGFYKFFVGISFK